MSAQVAVELIIGCVTFFLTSIVNAVIIGMFVGGVKADIRNISDRLAKIEGMFQLAPVVRREVISHENTVEQ